LAPPIPAVALAAKAPPTPRDPRPKSLPAPRDGLQDDLRQIKGIGPKIEATLHEMGVFHYDQIAAWTQSNAEWVDLRLGFKGRVAREQWVAQAKALAHPAAKAPRRVA
jgi:NADH-quinone oxidoreductase subunit E